MSGACYGCMAIFNERAALVDAVRRLVAMGCRDIEVYAPSSVEELDELLPAPRPIGWAAFVGGAIGGAGTFALEYYAAVDDYPVRVGGRPLDSWPAFVPASLEMTFLCAAIAAVLAMLVGNRLPRWYHPVFHVERFASVSQDAFALVVRAQGGHDADSLGDILQDLQPVHLEKVPW